jgi:hypothetical protein
LDVTTYQVLQFLTGIVELATGRHQNPIDRFVEKSQQNLVLAAEVPVYRGAGYTRLLAYEIDTDAVEPALVKKVHRGAQDAF